MASNPYVNKVVFGSATLVDLTGTTATADKILQGYGAFGADGAWMNGTATGGVAVTDVANTTGTTCVITTGSEPAPSETWETLYRDDVGWWLSEGVTDTYPYCWISDSTLIQVQPSIGSIWRVTFDDAVYRLTAKSASSTLAIGLGNPKYAGGTDDGSDVPFCIGYYGYGAWSGNADVEADSHHFMKIERLVTT